MEITDHVFKLYVGMCEANILDLKKSYYMEFTATLKLLTDSEIADLRRKIFKYKGWF